jgi:hypothetical protein
LINAVKDIPFEIPLPRLLNVLVPAPVLIDSVFYFFPDVKKQDKKLFKSQYKFGHQCGLYGLGLCVVDAAIIVSLIFLTSSARASCQPNIQYHMPPCFSVGADKYGLLVMASPLT